MRDIEIEIKFGIQGFRLIDVGTAATQPTRARQRECAIYKHRRRRSHVIHIHHIN